MGRGRSPVRGRPVFREIAAVNEPLTVSLSLDGFAAPKVFAFRALRPGEVRDLGDLRFDHGRAVRGTVESLGRGAVGASVVVAESWSDAIVRTDGKGAFTLIRMPQRPIWIRVRAEALPDHVFRVDDGAVVRLGRGGTVTAEGRATVWPKGDEWLQVDLLETEVAAAPRTLQAGAYHAMWEDGHMADFVVREGETTTIAPR